MSRFCQVCTISWPLEQLSRGPARITRRSLVDASIGIAQDPLRSVLSKHEVSELGTPQETSDHDAVAIDDDLVERIFDASRAARRARPGVYREQVRTERAHPGEMAVPCEQQVYLVLDQR